MIFVTVADCGERFGAFFVALSPVGVIIPSHHLVVFFFFKGVRFSVFTLS